MFLLLVFCIAAASARNIASIDKIVNGEDVPVGTYPWQCILRRSGSLTCGCIVVGTNTVITAAHCTGGSTSSYSVVVNRNDRTSNEGQIVDVIQIVDHPNYGSGPGFSPNDVAVVTTETITNPSPIALAGPTMSFVGETCFISGFGRLYGGGPLATVMQETRGKILSTSECQAWWGSSAQDNMVCIQNVSSGSCNGDSGGPLVCVRDNVYYALGVTSWGSSGCGTRSPSVYADIPTFATWMDNIASEPLTVGPIDAAVTPTLIPAVTTPPPTPAVTTPPPTPAVTTPPPTPASTVAVTPPPTTPAPPPPSGSSEEDD